MCKQCLYYSTWPNKPVWCSHFKVKVLTMPAARQIHQNRHVYISNNNKIASGKHCVPTDKLAPRQISSPENHGFRASLHSTENPCESLCRNFRKCRFYFGEKLSRKRSYTPHAGRSRTSRIKVGQTNKPNAPAGVESAALRSAPALLRGSRQHLSHRSRSRCH